MDGPYRAPELVPLGPLVREHRWRLTAQLIGLGIFFLSPLLLLPFAIKEGFEKWEVMSYFGAAIGLVGMPLGGIAILIIARKQSRNFVRIHAEGFDHRWKDVQTTVRWDDVVTLRSSVTQKVTNGIPGPVVHAHTVRTRDGRSLTITHGYADVDALVAELKKRSFDHLAKAAHERFLAGQEIGFGPLRVSKERGLICAKGALPWAELDGVEVRAGELKVQQRSPRGPRPWTSIDLAEIDNAEVLLALVERGTESVSS